MEYYKKVDKSMFRYGVTLPNKILKEFTYDNIPNPGTSRPVSLHWKKKRKKYEVSLLHVNRTGGNNVLQLRWDHNNELKLTLKKEFIQSYLAIVSRDFENKIAGKYYKTDLLGGNQEVLIFRSKNENEIELETFIKIEIPYDNTFKRLVDENVFGWLYKDPDLNILLFIVHLDNGSVRYYIKFCRLNCQLMYLLTLRFNKVKFRTGYLFLLRHTLNN